MKARNGQLRGLVLYEAQSDRVPSSRIEIPQNKAVDQVSPFD